MVSMMLTANRRDHRPTRIISVLCRLYAAAAVIGEQSDNGQREKHGSQRFWAGNLSVISAVVFALLAAGCAPHFTGAYVPAVMVAVSGAVLLHLIYGATLRRDRESKRIGERAVLSFLSAQIRDKSSAALRTVSSCLRTQWCQLQPRPAACIGGRSIAHIGLTPRLIPIPQSRA